MNKTFRTVPRMRCSITFPKIGIITGVITHEVILDEEACWVIKLTHTQESLTMPKTSCCTWELGEAADPFFAKPKKKPKGYRKCPI